MTEHPAPSTPNTRPLMPPPTEATSAAAIWSLVLAVLGILFIPLVLVAIVLGHVARSNCRKTPSLKGKGLALTALILSYAYTAVIVAAVVTFVVTYKSWRADLAATQTQRSNSQVSTGTSPGETDTNIPVTAVTIEADPQAVQTYIDAVRKDAVHPIDRVLADIDSAFSYLDREVFEYYPDKALPVLVSLVEDEGQYPKIRSEAALILLSLDPERGKQYFQRLVHHQDIEVRANALTRINAYDDLGKKHAEWFEPILLEQIQQKDPTIVSAVITAAASVPTPTLKKRLEAMLKEAREDAASERARDLVDVLTEIGSDDATIDVLLSQLSQQAALQYRHKERLENSFKWASAPARRKLLTHLEQRYRGGDEGAMAVLCEVADTDCLPLIEAYFENPAGEYRTDAFRAIMRLKGADALALLQAGFTDKKLRHSAVRAAADHFAGTANPVVLDALAQLNQTDFYSKTTIVAAAMAVSPDEVPVVVKEIVTTNAYPGYQRAPIFWHLKKFTVEQALADFIAAGLIDDRRYTADIAAIRAEYDHYSPYSVFMSVLEKAGHLTWFDVEVGMTPVPHHQLLYQFRDISRGVFQAAHIDQTVVGDPQKDEPYTYRLQWVFRDRLYSVAPQDHGDWYDLATVLDGANAALEDHQQPERFIMLDTGDQTAQVIFGDQEALETLAAKYFLPLVSDADASRARGKAFEEEVRRYLQSGEVR